MRLPLAILAAALVPPAGGAFGAAPVSTAGRVLTLEDRVAAHRAIEEVYWRHRIWPPENPRPKPPLAEVMPDARIRARVDDDLRKAKAVETYWKRPITAAQLQAEMNRVARTSRKPEILREIFAALGDDPVVIAESFVRPRLADRFLHDWAAQDARVQGPAKAAAETTAMSARSAADLRQSGGLYTEQKFLRGECETPAECEVLTRAQLGSGVVKFVPRPLWAQTATQLAAKSDTTRLVDTPESYLIQAVIEHAPESITLATVRWPKATFDSWWAVVRTTYSPDASIAPGAYQLATVVASPCADDTWMPVPTNAPTARNGHGMVWTGTEVLVLGGIDVAWSQYDGPSGGAYDPITDTWRETQMDANTPQNRHIDGMVWTGTEAVFWGGTNAFSIVLDTGGRYNPFTDSWTPMTKIGAPPGARTETSIVWTGTEVIVWGGVGPGCGIGLCNSGGRYNPASNSWAPVSTGANVPAGRVLHTAVWTTGKMIVWGGYGASRGELNDGAAYSPSGDAWTPLSSVGAPSPRQQHTAVWTNSEMIIWGGTNNTGLLKTGGRYKPSTNTWVSTHSEPTAPLARSGHRAIWTGTEMLIWGGGVADGGRYTPSTDSWVPISTATAQTQGNAVWTSSEMIVWGGSMNQLSTGYRYNKSTSTWVPMSNSVGAPYISVEARSIWTGAEVLVTGINTTRYDPATNTWIPISGSGAPPNSLAPFVVWTGKELISWGGRPGGVELNTGARYDPVLDTWTPMSISANAPPLRDHGASAWTGRELLIWGGVSDAGGYRADGAAYDPENDTWRAIPVSPNTPVARLDPAYAWTGSQLLVWGGKTGQSQWTDSGGRYDLASDSWLPQGISAGPLGERSSMGFAWSGSDLFMIGGFGTAMPRPYSDGARFDPVTDAWSAFVTGPNVPEPRYDPAAAWSGSEFLLWGGRGSAGSLASGGRYEPASGTWRPITAGAFAPTGGYLPSSAWIGSGWFTVGGVFSTNIFYWPFLSGAAIYCASGCSTPTGIVTLSVQPAPGTSLIGWSGTPGATSYDLVAGDLDSLHNSLGDFTASTTRCIAENVTSQSAADSAVPAPGGGFWYLLRPVNCGAGSYDSGSASQVSPRDAEIQASVAACR